MAAYTDVHNLDAYEQETNNKQEIIPTSPPAARNT